MLEPPFLTVREVAQRMRVSDKTVRKWIGQGRLRGVKISNRGGWRIPEVEVERLIAELSRP